MAFCPSCGSTVAPDDTFCRSCGRLLNAASVQDKGQAINPSRSGAEVPSQVVPTSPSSPQFKYCQICGNLNPIGVMYCQQCGSNQFGLNPPARIQRPTGVTIIGIIQMIFAIIDLLVALSIGSLIFAFAPGLVLVLIVISLLPLFFAIAFLTGRNWGRISMMIGAVLELFDIPIGTLIGIIVLYYLTRPKVVA
jgi:ribosomal protein L40E